MDKPQILAHVQKAVDYTLYDAKWIPKSAKFVALGSKPRATGAIEIYEITSGEANKIMEVEKTKGFRCGTFGASDIQSRNLATGDFDGRLQIWDLDKIQTPMYSADAHKEIINCIDGAGGLGVGEGPRELVTGSRDGSVKVWDPRCKDPVATIMTEEGEAKRDCWSVAFGDCYSRETRCICAGYDNGDIKLFDLNKMSLRWEHNVKNGVCGIEFDRKDIAMNKLLVSCLESKLHVFDLRTQHPKKGFACTTEKAHKSTVWCGRHLPQNRDVFMTGGGSGSLNLWKYNYPAERSVADAEGVAYGVPGNLSLLQNVTLSTQPLASLDWHPNKQGLMVSTAFDQTIRVIIVTKLNTL